MAFSLTAGSTSGIAVTGTPYLAGVTYEETSHKIAFIYSDGTSTVVTSTDADDAIAAVKLLKQVPISDFVKL